MPLPANIYSDEGEISQASVSSYSYMSQDSSNANQVETSFETEEGLDEWDRFVHGERQHEATPPTHHNPDPMPASKPAATPASEPAKPTLNVPAIKKPEAETMPAEESDFSEDSDDDREFSSSESSGYSSSSSSSMSSSSSSSSSSEFSSRRNELDMESVMPKTPMTPANVWRSAD